MFARNIGPCIAYALIIGIKRTIRFPCPLTDTHCFISRLILHISILATTVLFSRLIVSRNSFELFVKMVNRWHGRQALRNARPRHAVICRISFV